MFRRGEMRLKTAPSAMPRMVYNVIVMICFRRNGFQVNRSSGLRASSHSSSALYSLRFVDIQYAYITVLVGRTPSDAARGSLRNTPREASQEHGPDRVRSKLSNSIPPLRRVSKQHMYGTKSFQNRPQHTPQVPNTMF